MRTIIFLIACCCMMSLSAPAQDNKKTDTIKVYGNCDMCKSTIEGSLKKKDGIVSKKWNTETKMLTVTYDPSKVTIQQIGQKIADVGYDNEYARAKDEVYGNLHKCCKYERPKK